MSIENRHAQEYKQPGPELKQAWEGLAKTFDEASVQLTEVSHFCPLARIHIDDPKYGKRLSVHVQGMFLNEEKRQAQLVGISVGLNSGRAALMGAYFDWSTGEPNVKWLEHIGLDEGEEGVRILNEIASTFRTSEVIMVEPLSSKK